MLPGYLFLLPVGLVKKIKGFRIVRFLVFPVTAKLRWLKTVFDTYFSFKFFSKTLDPLVAKNRSKQVNNTNFGFFIVKLTFIPLPCQRE